jgi:hypothetical protein
MFVNAIEEVAKFTKPIHTITRFYGETIVNPGSSTLFFVNELGCAITCKHVIDLVGARDAINNQYKDFKAEKNAVGKNNKYNKRLKELEQKYKYKDEAIIQLKEQFVGCTHERSFRYKWINHPTYDLSILIFEDFKNPAYESFAHFIKDSSTLKQGKFLCRLGFPFPEFTNFKYNEDNDDIEWTTEGIAHAPRFPVEGMLTRHFANDGKIWGIEMSTPGLRGQSGGPLFDPEGNIAGLQASTHHLHLGFDMKNVEYKANGRTIKVTNQPFLHVGQCIHVDVIKDFLKSNNIRYYER